MIKTIAIPQSLLNEQSALAKINPTLLNAAELAEYNIRLNANKQALSLVGDQPMTAQEIADRQAEESANTSRQAIEQAQALITAMRAERDRLMAETVGWQARLDRQVRQSLPLTFTQLQIDTYTKALADLPSVYPTGVDVIYPVKP